MIKALPPAAVFIAGALIIPLLRGRARSAYLLALPVVAFLNLLYLPSGLSWEYEFMGFTLVFSRVDNLSLIFSYVFILIAFIGIIYALHLKESGQHVAAFCYAGGATGVTLAGDLFSLYLFWEIMALASTYLILSQKCPQSRSAAYRYFMWHFFGGVCLLAGIVLYFNSRGTTQFDLIGLSDAASFLIFIGFCLNAAVFPFHAWLPDAYPRATVTGAVFMSALTTKSAVYILARTFPGTEILMWAGAFMTCFPIFYAVIVNDMRRVLAYSLINQVGFMVCGIGVGSTLAINGVVAHAFCHIIYKALLFMSTGAVLQMTGKIRGTDLGGLYKTMPYTAVCCMIGAASISAFPMFSGFISKSLTVAAVADAHQVLVWFMLLFASAGVFHHAGIKVPYFTFFGHDSRIRTKEPPLNMRIAMGMAAFICIFLGIYPAPLYAILPYPLEFEPYSAFHVVSMLQLLMFGALAFTLLILSGYYPAELRASNLDTDWFARIPGRWFMRFCHSPLRAVAAAMELLLLSLIGLLRNIPALTARIEERTDRAVHGTAAATPSYLLDRLNPLKTEIGRLAWNVAYVLIPFIVLLLIILTLKR
jgi:multicomponent Na+:H+ antiporter subunit D